MLILYMRFLIFVSAWSRCQRGATSIEYGLIAASITAVIAFTLNAVGDETLAMFTQVSSELKGMRTP